MLEVRNIFKAYESKLILNNISFSVGAGETVCLLGASGSGKSTLLRIISGLESPDSGLVLFNGLDLVNTAPHLRDFGLVFQDYALFPHLNVYDNVAFGLKMRRVDQDQIAQRVVNALELVNLSGFDTRQVTDLSGGEQQRVALARALAPRPRLLMFDEPLGALDRTLREDLLNELRSILHQTNIPAIYVTHDQEEAFTIADRVLMLHNGGIVRAGAPAEVWARPESAFVAQFLGLGNVIEGQVSDQQKDAEWTVQSDFGVFAVRCAHKHQKGDKVHLLARPLSAENDRAAKSSKGERSQNVLQGVVSDVIFQQERFRVVFENGLYFYMSAAPKVGEKVAVRVKVECLA
ncbi:MAG: ABC transporter ATP-binding protein [Chloroflexota bacterium]|nr:ABC transporter ATP-binding protein [Chloroflexota bacterium]